MGAYLQLVTPGIPILGAFMYNAIYKMDGYRFRCTGVFTTKTPTDAYRGAGRPEATFAIERIVTELAARARHGPDGAAPEELDRARGVPVHHRSAGLTYDSGNYEAATGPGAGAVRLRRAARASRPSGASGRTRCSWASASRRTPRCAAWRRPGCSARCRTAPAAGRRPRIRMLPTGKVEVVTGTTPHGQGHVTSWSQIAADALGVPFEDVERDRRRHPVLAAGHGHVRVALAGRRRGRGAPGRAEGGREGPQGRRAPAGGRPRATSSSTPARSRSRARRTRRRRSRRSRWRPSPRTTCPRAWSRRSTPSAVLDPENFSFPHGTHLCAVEVDTETGRTTIRSYVAVDDVGKVVNPMIVEGQVHGGIAQGIAQALYEEAVYDADGNLVTGTMVDYLVPAAPGPAGLHHRPHRDPVDDQPARRQGRRRGRHDRLHAGGGQRGGRRAPPLRRRRRPDAVHAGAGLAGDPRARLRRRRPGCPRARSPTAARRPRPRPEVPSDPPGVRLPAAALGRRGGHRARPGRRGRQGARRRAEPAAAAAAAAGVPDRAGRPRRGRRAARRPAGRRPAGHRRDDHAPRGDARPAGRHALPGAGRRRPRRSPTRRCGTAAPSAGRSRTPTRPATCRRWRWRWTPSSSSPGPDGRRHVPAAEFFSDYLETAVRPGELLVEIRVPVLGPELGLARTRSSTGSPRRGRSSAWRRWSAGTATPSPRRGSG